jgi:two-component system chemotaxis response regulator CheY
MAKRILIVDDAAVIRDLIGLLLSEYDDFVVTMATNGRQAHEMLQANKFDLAIVDLNMPEMNGVELIKAIRADARTRTLPVIVCTANDHAQMIQEAESIGIEAYVLKPFKNKELLLLVSQLVG